MVEHQHKCSRTIASSEQEAASTPGLVPETDSRCLLSLTQAFDGRVIPDARFRQRLGGRHEIYPWARYTVGSRRAATGPFVATIVHVTERLALVGRAPFCKLSFPWWHAREFRFGWRAGCSGRRRRTIRSCERRFSPGFQD